MTLITKVDFQDDELHIHYHVKGDSDKHIRSRVLVVNWRGNSELTEILKQMFQSIINKYIIDGEGVKIDWERFFSDFKAYEERCKDDNK